MKIMISQPFRGKTEKQIRDEREELVKRLEAEGHEVLETIFTEEAPEDIDTPIFHLAKSIEVIGKVDAIVFMPGWEKARGCRIEYQVAKDYGKFIKEEE